MTNSVQSAVLGRVPISFIFECQQTNERARMDGEETFHFTPRSFLVRVLPKNGMSGMPLGKMGLYLLELYGTEYTRPYCYTR